MASAAYHDKDTVQGRPVHPAAARVVELGQLVHDRVAGGHARSVELVVNGGDIRAESRLAPYADRSDASALYDLAAAEPGRGFPSRASARRRAMPLVRSVVPTGGHAA